MPHRGGGGEGGGGEGGGSWAAASSFQPKP